MLWGLAATLLLVGAALLALALRGRRVGDAPHCRRCGFNLSGLPKETARCPECGSDVSAPNCVRLGQHRRRPGAIVLGVIAMILAIGCGVLGVSASRPGWNSWKPASLLLWEARQLHGKAADAAVAEMLARDAAATLASAVRDRLVDLALTRMESSDAWQGSAWQRVLDHALASGLLSPESAARFARAALGDIHLDMPERVLSNGEIDIEAPAPSTIRGRLRQPLFFGATLLDAAFDDCPVPLRFWDWRHNVRSETTGIFDALFFVNPAGIHEIGGSLSDLGPITVSQGPHRIRTRWRIDVWLDDPQSAQSMPIASWEIDLNHDLTGFLDPQDVVHVVRSTDPDSLPTPEVSISPRPSGFSPPDSLGGTPHVESVRVLPDGREEVSLRWSVRLAEDPRSPSVVGPVTLRAGDRSIPLNAYEVGDEVQGPEIVILGQGTWQRLRAGYISYVLDLGRPDRVDFVISPDLAVAARVPVARLWGEEIVIKDVPIDWSKIGPPDPDAAGDSP